MLRATVKSDLSRMDAYERKIDRLLEPTVSEITDAIIEDIRTSWSPESPSPVGSPPAVVTGDLDRSIQKEKQGRTAGGQFAKTGEAVTFVIKAGVPYSGILETYLDRPFFEPAFDRAALIFDVGFKVLFR